MGERFEDVPGADPKLLAGLASFDWEMEALRLSEDRDALLSERDEARADAARWKAEADRLRKALDRAALSLSAARMHVGSRDAYAMLDKEAFMAASALSAGGGTDA